MIRRFQVYLCFIVALVMGTWSCNGETHDGVDSKTTDLVTDGVTTNPGNGEDVNATLDPGGSTAIDATVKDDPGPDTMVSFGIPCQTNSECPSGFCVPSRDGHVCTNFCVDDCPDGWTCRAVELPGQDITFLCLDRFANTCRPCETNTECRVLGGMDSDRCVDFGDREGSFCGADCSSGIGCPMGYSCETITEPDTRQFYQLCQPDSGQCECNLAAIADGAQTSCNEGECAGLRFCGESGLSECSAKVPTDEVCDSSDNNCNGEADEDLGTTTCGLGVCEHAIENCVDGAIQFCDPFEGGSVEICDGHDNNCDGDTDEALGSTSCGQGPCAHTVENCVGGVDQLCDPLEGAAEEICDWEDNNCNGLTDEGLGFETCGVGACAHTTKNCIGGLVQTCDPLEGATEEICDGLDNNCDGGTDEDLGSTTCGLGACAHTVESCVAGSPQFCNPFEGATPEICDGDDNDCDGSADEDLGNTTCGLGACAHTTENCVGGLPQTCDPLEGSTVEVCDGTDNDCDGNIDEDLGSATCGLGACAHTIDNCGGALTQTCDPFEGSSVEVCDGVDNDCDGNTDEGLSSSACGAGACAHSIENCVGGVTQTCDPLEGSSVEVCDGTDNDCDGNTDEDFSLLGAACSIGTGACAASGVWTCSPGPGDPLLCAAPVIDPVLEICDGVDNDCDGNTDEDLGNTTCGIGACLHTVENCAGGSTQTCDPLEGASVEICDSIDNDCDGKTDAEDDSVVALCAEGDSCLTIRNNNPGAVSDYYAIDPTGSGEAFLAFCNMNDHGGGWTLAASISALNHNHIISGAINSDGDGLVSDDNQGDKFADTVIDALWTDRIWVQIKGGSGDIHCEHANQPPAVGVWSTTGSYTCGYTFTDTTTVSHSNDGCSPGCPGPAVWVNYDYRSYGNLYPGCYGAAATYVPSGNGGCGNHPSRNGALWIR